MAKNKWRLLVTDEIENELDESLPSGDDMIRAERLRSVVLKKAFEGKL